MFVCEETILVNVNSEWISSKLNSYQTRGEGLSEVNSSVHN